MPPQPKQVQEPISTNLEKNSTENDALWWIPQTWLEVKLLNIVNTGKQSPVKLTVEVAKTFDQRAIGLMFRTLLAVDHGMLFVFEEEKERSFWMKNTFIGLDLLYVSSDWFIKHIHNNAIAEDLTSLPSQEPVQYVIEVNDDFVETHNIQVGDKVEGI